MYGVPISHFNLQVAATEEKTILEEAQRSEARERKAKCEEWFPKYFTQVGHCTHYRVLEKDIFYLWNVAYEGRVISI